MLKNWRNINFHLISFFIIIIIASGLRLGGIYPSYPPYHSDEGMSYAQGIAMVRENTIDAHGYSLALGYPSLVPIINAVLFKSVFIPMAWSKFTLTSFGKFADGIIHLPLTQDDYKRIFQLEILGNREIYVLTWGRIIAAFTGIGVVFAIYLLIREIFDKRTALFSSLLVAISYRQVFNSHINLPDIYNAFFLTMSMVFSYRIINHKEKKDYLLAGIFIGLSIATKFLIYSAVAFLIIFLISSIKDKVKFKDIIFSYKFFITVFASIIVFMLINPYHFIYFEHAYEIIHYSSLKYGAGRFALNLFPFWYLFNFGIGRVTTIVSILGMIVMLIKKPKAFIFIFSAVGSFFYFLTYATNGGFYTRNFVTITPLVLVFGGYFLSFLLDLKKIKSITYVLFVILFGILFYENFSEAIVVPIEYSKPWNYEVLGKWISNNIPKGSRVSAHSSVPLPDYTITRLPYDDTTSLSLQEFIKDKADFSVTNLDWITNNYYDWMNSFTKFYRGKPINELENYYSAMATEELSDYSIYSIIKPALTAESDFVVSKIPKFNIISKTFVKNFDNVNSEWTSEPLNISSFSGILIQGRVKNGFIFANFYKNLSDTSDVTKRIATRVSAREKDIEETKEEIITNIPVGADYMIVGFANFSISDKSQIHDLDLYNAKIQVNLEGFNVHRTSIPKDVLFPNSQGNL